jgi:hypothetical protein
MHTEKLLQATNLRLIATRILELHQEGLKIFACCTREDQHEYNYINARQTSARRPVARALPQLRLAPGQPVSPLDFSSVGRTDSHRAPGHCASRCDYSSSELHRLYCAYAVHPNAPSRCSTSRRSVALALAVRPVAASRGATTRRPDCTGSTAPMPCIWKRRLDARLRVSRSYWLSLCARSLRCAS